MELLINTDIINPLGLSMHEYLFLFYLNNELPVEQFHIDTSFLEDNGFIKLDESFKPKIRDKGKRIFLLKEDAFTEFWNMYPSKVTDKTGASRVLKTEGLDTKQAREMRIKYLGVLKSSPGVHEKIILGLKNELFERKRSGNLGYMQNVETYLNQFTWEKYVNNRVEQEYDDDTVI